MSATTRTTSSNANRAQRRAQARKKPTAQTQRNARRLISREWAKVTEAVRLNLQTQTLKDVERQNVAQASWISLRALVDGPPEDPYERWGYLAQTINVALVLTEARIGDEFLPELTRAARIATEIKQRGLEAGDWRIRPEEIAPLERALEIHDAQLEIATRQEIIAACDELRRRLSARQTPAKT